MQREDADDRNGASPNVTPIPRISLNADDAAKALGISKRKLFEITNAGELPYVEAGPQTYLYDPKDLADWLNKKKKTKPQGGAHG